MAWNFYQSYHFKNSELSLSHQLLIEKKEQEILTNMQKHFGLRLDVDLIVTNRFKGRLYGLTALQNGHITIYLNKKVMQESMEYMVESVIAHEYAHALMMHFGKLREGNDGHSREWQVVCLKLGGKDCSRYVDTQEIIMSKMPFR